MRKEDGTVEIIIRGEPKEIAALVLAVQGRRVDRRSTEDLAGAIRGILLEFAGKA